MSKLSELLPCRLLNVEDTNFDMKAYIDARIREMFDAKWLAEREAEEEAIINGHGPTTGVLHIKNTD